MLTFPIMHLSYPPIHPILRPQYFLIMTTLRAHPSVIIKAAPATSSDVNISFWWHFFFSTGFSLCRDVSIWNDAFSHNLWGKRHLPDAYSMIVTKVRVIRIVWGNGKGTVRASLETSGSKHVPGMRESHSKRGQVEKSKQPSFQSLGSALICFVI